MPFTQRLRFTLKYYSILILILLAQTLSAQNIIKDNLYPSKTNKALNEINEIRFEGNTIFEDSELQSYISSLPTNKSWEHRIFQYYYDEFNRNKAAKVVFPPGFFKSIESYLKKLSEEIRFFDQTRADNDLIILKELYNQNGYHFAEAFYTFEADSDAQINVLTYHITENKPFVLQSIFYRGLDSLPNNVQDKIDKVKIVKIDKTFSEADIINEVKSILRILLDNGYFFATFEIPTVTMDTTALADSVTIIFDKGNRYKIGSITYVDSLMEQKKVTDGMKSRQLEFQTGEWYSKTEIEQSRNNLIGLGTFEIASIDTNSIFSKPSDSTLSFLVYTKYRKQQDWGVSIYVNRTAIDNYNNIGGELSYFNRNLFGTAESGSIFARFEWQNINFQKSPEFESQLGGNFAQPLLWVIDKARIGFSFQALYSIGKINYELRLGTFSLQAKFPMKLLTRTYINTMSFDFFLERQSPMNYNAALNALLKQATTEADTDKVHTSFRIYQALNNFTDTSFLLAPTAFIFGFSAIGDKRNDIFAPTQGYYFNFSFDGKPGIGGIANYLRSQLAYYYFTSLTPTTTFALKLRGGFIWWYDRENSYVPIERQFFAGGANSVRGWLSRRLRYPQPDKSNYSSNDSSNAVFDFFQDYMGSAAIIEGSLELRLRFRRQKDMSGFFATLVDLLRVNAFLDLGNTFHWLADDSYNYKWEDYIKGLAVAGGLGIGFQTPVGPFRIDAALPIYDPSRKNDQTIFTRKFDISNLVFHIGLGYAF